MKTERGENADDILPNTLRTPGEGQFLHAKDNKACDRLQRRIGDAPDARQAVKHGVERRFHLQTRPRSAEAEMDAPPEAQMPVRLALDVEPIRLGELGLVTIRRAKPGKDPHTLLFLLCGSMA